jgi:hypothetical protein
MTDVLTQLSSQYALRGQFADLSDIIRDSMAHRSNMMMTHVFNTTSVTVAEKAAKLYNDWETDVPAEWPTTVKKRNRMPHVFHTKVGKWVPTHSRLEWLPDMNDWIVNNATTSAGDREEYLNNWINLSRLIRIKSPYCYYPVQPSQNNKSGSIIVRNIDPNISDADLLMGFSAFGPIIDLHHPLHWKNKKRSFFIFIEYDDVASIDKLFAETDGLLYFRGCPITIERAGSRKTSDAMKAKSDAVAQ